ncbi:MAG TPA: DUF4232 domain-containing protein [Streptosporangiaceae bacterium]|nr:DUF4232 domain-containing protein [Streptosporangiaceae bacterium]
MQRRKLRILASALGAAGLAAGCLLAPAAASAAATPRCLSENLRVRFIRDNGYAGGYVYDVLWQNEGTSVCTLTGYPGTSALGSLKRVLGKPAGRDVVYPVTTVTIPTGGIVVSFLRITDVAAYSKAVCNQALASFLRIYPPGAFLPDVINTAGGIQVCRNARASAPVYMATSPVVP